MSDLPQHLRFNATIPLVMEAAARIEQLEADLSHWVQQAENNSGDWQRACLRIYQLEAALRHIEDALGYDKNEGKSPAVRESNAHIAWKIARAALAPEQDK